MKRFLIIISIILLSAIPTFADILPESSTEIQPNALGMYQVPKHFVVYKKPDKNSDILYEANWDYKTFNATEGNDGTIFSVLVQQKELAFIQVVDITEDWIEVIYNKKANKTGWIQSEDLRFMNWRSFYNTYGRKYGLKLLTEVPESIKKIHSATEEESQVIGQLPPHTQKIKLTTVKGNWALVTVIDLITKTANTGFLRYRANDGTLYLFPDIK